MEKLRKFVLTEEVVRSDGCTEVGAIAYAAGVAMAVLKRSTNQSNSLVIEGIEIIADSGLLKNALSAGVPGANGQKGPRIAAAMGAIIGNHEDKLAILQQVDEQLFRKAEKLVKAGKISVECDWDSQSLMIKLVLKTSRNQSSVTIEDGHTNVTEVICDGKDISQEFSVEKKKGNADNHNYLGALKELNIRDLVEISDQIDEEDEGLIKEGVKMNLTIAEDGMKYAGYGKALSALIKKGYHSDDCIAKIKASVGAATHARMIGVNMPVMSSGGSGNQGIVAILPPYLFGKYYAVDDRIILESIALSHMINSYIHAYTGKLFVMCGCAIAAGIGAAAAVAYQLSERNVEVVEKAINNVIADISGMLCDGAKVGCAKKVMTASENAIASALYAYEGIGADHYDGIVGRTPEESIKNMVEVGRLSSKKINKCILEVLLKKTEE